MIKAADNDGTGYVSCNEFSGLLNQNLFDIADNLDVELERPGVKRKKSTHRSVMGRKSRIMRSTYMKKPTNRR